MNVTTNSYLSFNYAGWWFTTSKEYSCNTTAIKYTYDGMPIYPW